MKLARSVTMYEDFVEEFQLALDLTNADINASVVCPIIDDERSTTLIEILDAEVGKVRITVKQEMFKEFRFEDLYVIVHTYKLARAFNPLTLWITVKR